MQNATYNAPLAPVNSTDRGGALLVVNIVTLAVSLASVALRFFISHHGRENGFAIYKDDLLCCAATVFCIVEFALAWAGVSEGNGMSMDLISPQSLVHIQQIQYAADIFYIASLFCSRASVLFLLERVQNAPSNTLWWSALGILSAVEAASLFMTALKCDLSKPWIEYDVQCTGLLARWEAIEISGMVIEGGIFALVIYLVFNLQMSLGQKAKVVGLFGTRVMVIVFAALRIAYLPSYFHSQNPTYSGIIAAIFALTEMHASLVTATTPLLKSFILKFKVIGQKPTFVIASQQYGSRANADGPNPNGNRGKRKENGESIAMQEELCYGAVWNSEHEPWPLRSDSQDAEAKLTSSSDDDGSYRAGEAI